MLSRINVFKIIKDHFKTLRNLNDEKPGMTKSDTLLFLGVPVLLSAFLVYYKITVRDHISDFITVFSIFGGFLFNLLAIIYGLMDKFKVDAITDLKKIFAREIHINIAFDILMSIFIVILLLIYSFLPSDYCAISITFDFVVFFLILMFTLTLLMIINRVYILMKKEN